MLDNKIISRILKKYNISGYDALLKEMPSSDLQSLLIEIYNQRAKNITPSELLEQYKKNRFVQPSKLNPQDILTFETLAHQFLPNDFKSLELSPVTPLGTVSMMTSLSQSMSLTTIRNTEVCSDVTNVLALESAILRKKLLQQKETKLNLVKLCASHRLLRAQFFDNPLFTAHFQILSLCIAGRDEGNFKFELSALEELVCYFHKLINQYIFSNIAKKQTIKFMIFTHNELLLDKLEDLSRRLSHGDDLIVTAEVNSKENWNYYGQTRFKIFLCANEELFIGDGGDTSWTQQLLSDKKERYMISGLGSELLLQYVKNQWKTNVK